MPVTAALLLWAGATLVLSTFGPLRTPSLVRRLRPYLVAESGDSAGRRRPLVALSLLVGDRLLRRGDPLEVRLRRAGHHLDAGGFRLRQFGHAVLALAAVGLLLAAGPLAAMPGAAAALVLGSAPAVIAAHEQALAVQERRRTQQVVRELPVVAEQLAMLLAAGRSVAVAVGRLGDRGRGPSAEDLRRVARRLHQGADEPTALREWADLRRAPGISHLVGVLTLAGEATDLDRLVEQEAEAIRSDAHRGLLAELERRSQQVWVPVTVATLLPGSLLLLVPFLDALRLFAGA